MSGGKMLEDIKRDEAKLPHLMKDEVEKSHAFLKWIVLIASGAFSISFGALIGDKLPSELLTLAKLALTFNALAILTGVISVNDDAHLASGIKSALVDQLIKRVEGKYKGENLSYTLPLWRKLARRACFLFMLLTLFTWIIFIWMF